jgi:S-adenosylmethionine-diacylglycerol 3-amino-3-carboxypropyl transferase
LTLGWHSIPMVENKLQFAVVREDPRIESELLNRSGPESNVFLIGSGGCTALTLRGQFPKASITILDPNPKQLDLIRRKVDMLSKTDVSLRNDSFGIGADNPESLTSCGNFESLFRTFRDFIYEFVCARDEWLGFFTDPKLRFSFEDRVFKSKYWPVAFKLFFSDSLLVAMFGNGAIQHAPPGSYPGYFQKVFEAGLTRDDARTNYFLHHIFLGHYLDLPACLPSYLSSPSHGGNTFEYVEALAQAEPDFSHYDVISLSNIFDWMDTSEVSALANRLSNEMKSGAWLVYRQLNNYNDFRQFLEPTIQFDNSFAKRLLANDRSLFYSSLNIGQKIRRIK